MNNNDWRKNVYVLGLLLVFMQSLYLHRLPGFFGDEASEGINVYQILTGESLLTILGERSYIGPLIDYVRIPFVAVFGYTALALRVPMLLFSILTFALGAAVFRRLVGNNASLMMLAALFFSPIYLLYQRLGWAVTLFPFFALLLLYIVVCYTGRHKPLLAGLVAGLGLHNYVTFLPTIFGILVAAMLGTTIKNQISRNRLEEGIAEWWPFLVGFSATFGTQFGVLNLYQEDQGDPYSVAAHVGERITDLPAVLPQLLSGDVYMASYGAPALAPTLVLSITAALAVLIGWALLARPHRTMAWVWLTGVIVQVIVLLVMIDRFTLRYFVIFNLGLWTLAGLGAAKLLPSIVRHLQVWQPTRVPADEPTPQQVGSSRAPVVSALALSAFVGYFAFIPFLTTGGQWRYFSLDDPKSPAEIKVDILSLLTCLKGKALVYAEDIHIQNRLLYLQYSYPELLLASGKETAQWYVHYRQPTRTQRSADEVCPELTNFIVTTPEP